jgi:hypothetical protein
MYDFWRVSFRENVIVSVLKFVGRERLVVNEDTSLCVSVNCKL